jgi:hypothetical protein
MPSRTNKSTLSGSSSSHVYGGSDTFNARISEQEFNSCMNLDRNDDPDLDANGDGIPDRLQRGSGSDKNSDTSRLGKDQNLLDKEVEDTFPASDPPSHSPMTGVGRGAHGEDPSGLPSNFKNDKAAQFEYGRQSQASTQHFDTSTDRLRRGNPDIGEVDLGNIEANRPAEPDDSDHLD